MLIDTHAHLYWESFKTDFDEMIQQSLAAEVSTIINVGVDIEKSQVALEQAKNTKWPKGLSVYSTIGIHPHEAVKYDSDESMQQDIKKLEQIYFSGKTKVIGIGECGLDYFFDPEFIPSSLTLEDIKILQKKLFQAHINLAKKLNLPLIVHCRDDRSEDPQNSECWNEVIEMTKDHFGIYHCYSGLLPTTNYLLSRSSTKSGSRILDECNSSGQSTNFLISFAATITYPKNDYLREAVKIVPLNRIVLETDCPFLPPQSKRGIRNEPAAVKEIAELIADLKGISFKKVAKQTTENAKKIFNI